MINTSQIMGMRNDRNENVRIYHVRYKLMDRYFDRQPAMNDLLYLIPGITHVSATPYSVAVSKAVMYKWEEIEPQIEAIFDSHTIRHQGNGWKS